MTKEVVYQAAALRGRGDFQDAIDLVEKNRANLDEYSRIPALIQAFQAAVEGGLVSDARRLAAEIAQEEPNLPSIQNYLKN